MYYKNEGTGVDTLGSSAPMPDQDKPWNPYDPGYLVISFFDPNFIFPNYNMLKSAKELIIKQVNKSKADNYLGWSLSEIYEIFYSKSFNFDHRSGVEQ